MPADHSILPRHVPIRAAFCSSRDRKDRVIFDGEYFSYLWWRWHSFNDLEAKSDFYAALCDKQAAGVTHVTLQCPNGEPYRGGNNWITELPRWVGADGRLDPLFIAMAQEILKYFYGVFYAYGGGQGDALHIYDGNLRRMFEQTRDADIAGKCTNGWAWESTGRGPNGEAPECTSKQNYDAVAVMSTVLGPDADIFLHVGAGMPLRFTYASWPHEPDDPTHGDEVGAYFVGFGRAITRWFTQLKAEDYGPTPGYEDRLIEGLDRFLPFGTPMPGIGLAPLRREKDDHGRIDDRPCAIGPTWFDASRGYVDCVDWEPGIPWGYIRGTVTEDTVVRIYRKHQSLGIRSFGCLPVPART